VRTSLDPAKPVIGQHVRLVVEVLFPDRMPAPPQVVTPQAPGLQIFRFESQGLTMRDTIEGQRFVGQRFEFALYPRRAGTLAVPPVEIRLMDRSGDVTGKAAGEAQTLTVSGPLGVDPGHPSIASHKVTLTESWERAAAKEPLHAGDALVRVIKREADDTPALGFAAPNLNAPEGVRAYADQPISNDRIERGTLMGERIDQITYVFEKPGDYALPAITQSWWDLSSDKLRREVGAGRTVSVAAAESPMPTEGERARFTRLDWRALAALALGVVVLAALMAVGVARLARARRSRRESGPSPSVLFRELNSAAGSGDARATYRALARAAACLDPAMLSTLPPVRDLERSLFAGRDMWSRESGEALLKAVRSLPRGSSRTPRRPDLPPLNPAVREAPW
jgi:hypothetical protein